MVSSGLTGAVLVAMPKQPLDALEGVQQALTGCFVMVDDTTRILFKHGYTHGDMKPVEDVLGFRGDQLGQRSDFFTAIRRKVTS